MNIGSLWQGLVGDRDGPGDRIVPPTAAVRMIPEGTPAGLARRIRRAVLARRARVIYPRAYAVTRHFPAITRVVMDAFTPLPAGQLAATKPADDDS